MFLTVGAVSCSSLTSRSPFCLPLTDPLYFIFKPYFLFHIVYLRVYANHAFVGAGVDQAHPGDTIRAEESSSEDSEDDGSDTAVITTESASDSSSTLGQESLNGSGEDGNEGSSYSDGVIDVQPKKYFGTTAGSIDINNSLHISSGGKFHLGPQWHVPDAGTAHSNAGPKLGPVSVFSSWSTNEFDVEEDPSTPRRDSNDMEGSFCGQYNTAASPTTPVGSDCYNIDSPEGTGSHENQFSTVVEKINDMDLSMTGAC